MKSLGRSLFVAAALTAILGPAGAQAVTIDEYPVPTGSGAPESITAGPDGSLWFTAGSLNEVGKVTTAGVFTLYTSPSGIFLRAITVGSDGNLWFTEFLGGKIRKVTTAGAFTEYAIPNASGIGIAAGPDGNLWFTEIIANKIGTVTTAGAFAEYNVPTGGSEPIAITAGSDGNLWFVERAANQIGKVTTAGVFTEYPIPTASSYAQAITAGPDGNIWYTGSNGNQIGKVTTAGVFTEYTVPTVNSGPLIITAGPDGNLWFTENGANTIGKVTTTGVFTEYPLPTANSSPIGIITGPDGDLWFTEGSGKIGRVGDLSNPMFTTATPTQTPTVTNTPTPSQTPTVTPTPTPVCGDGTVNAGEQCDDGNILNGDCCSSTCQIEPTCFCGDGVVEPQLGEQCDLGATNGATGTCCTLTCQVSPSSTVCRAAVAACDATEYCTGVGELCPADGLEADGTACDDSNACTADDVCASGTCQGTPACDPCEECNPTVGCALPVAPACQPALATKASVSLKDNPNNAKDSLTWKWTSSETVLASDFGDPVSATLPVVAVIGSPSTAAWNADVQSKLVATGKFSRVDVFDTTVQTPTLVQLQSYCSVLAYTGTSPANSTALGNNLADYVDSGGGVVAAVFAGGGSSVRIHGRFDTGGYWVIQPGLSAGGPSRTLGSIYVPSDPILAGVSSFSGGSSSYRPYPGTLTLYSTRVANWSDGTVLVARREINGVRRADLGFFPPSSDARADLWDASTDGARIMANALDWTCRKNDISICVIDQTGGVPTLRLSASAPAGGTCAGKPCWKAKSSGASYGDKDLAPDGISKFTFKTGGPGKAKIRLTGKGGNLDMPTMPLVAPVTVRLKVTNAPACWESTFSTPKVNIPAVSNKPGVFKAKSD